MNKLLFRGLVTFAIASMLTYLTVAYDNSFKSEGKIVNLTPLYGFCIVLLVIAVAIIIVGAIIKSKD